MPTLPTAGVACVGEGGCTRPDLFSIGGILATSLGAQPGLRGGALLKRLWGDRIDVSWVAWGRCEGHVCETRRGQVATGATPHPLRAISRSSSLSSEPHLIGLKARFTVGVADMYQEDW